MSSCKRYDDFRERTHYDKVGATKNISDLIDVYHYTSASALKSIIENKSIYLTKSDFMNDVEEIEYSLKMIEMLTKKHPTLSEHLKERICDQLLNVRKKYFFGNTYIMSFSKESDSLALWVNYGKEDGYSIKFSKEFFHDIFSGPPKFIKLSDRPSSYGYSVKVNEVIYDECIQTKIIIDLLDEIDFYDKNASGEDKSAYILIMVNFIVDHIPFFKSPGHKPEKEYRLIVEFEYEDYKQSILKHRVFRGAFIPYVEYGIDLNIIKEITIGPTNNFDLVNKGLTSFVESNPTLNVDIKKSQMILRF